MNPIQAQNAQAGSSEPLHIFSGLWSNLGDTLWGWNWAYYGSAFAGTGLLVDTGLDEKINSHVQRNNPWSRSTQVAFLNWGNFIQAIPHTSMFLYGYFGGNNKLAAAGAAGLQAMGISGGMVFVLKWASGRPRPVYDSRLDETPRDREFNWNVLKQSIDSDRYRWPSGHTSSAFTAAAAFSGFYHDNIWLSIVAYPLATLMGYAMIIGQYHWASDVLAGALIGQAVGYTVGRNFRRMYDERENSTLGYKPAPKELSVSFSPWAPSDGGAGIAAIATF